MNTSKEIIHRLGDRFFDEVVEIRRHFHRYPELSCREFSTAAFIAEKLQEYGIEFQQGIAGTGLVGLIHGREPGSRCIALRADMDALPITEENDISFKSEHPGIMHACGHDVHMACLLGAARILQECRNELRGAVKLIFQPSEETYPGGAITMIGEGVLENPAPSVIIAQHVINTLEKGYVGFRSGQYMASTDEFFLTVKGKGGHAATPAQVVDPIVIASHIVIALQQIVSRHADPVMPTVVSIGKIMGEGRTNVIPDVVRMEGTVRTYNETWRKDIHGKIEQISTGIARAMGAECDVHISGGYPSLYNNPEITNQLQQWAVEYLGDYFVADIPPRTTAEDFAYFAERVPSCLYRLGISNKEKGIGSNLHSANFNVDEESLKPGMELMAWFALNLLK